VKAGFLATTILEVSAVAVLVSDRYRLFWLVATTLFHILTLFLMNILFWENVLLLFVTLGPMWSREKESRRLTVCLLAEGQQVSVAAIRAGGAPKMDYLAEKRGTPCGD
jgi:hypothetical protein